METELETELETEHELICRYMDGECEVPSEYLLIHKGDLRTCEISGGDGPEGYPILKAGTVIPVCRFHVCRFPLEEYIVGSDGEHIDYHDILRRY